MIATETGFDLESFEYHRDSKTYRFEYDQDTTPAGMAVVAALSEVMDTDSTALKPLQDTVDVDALNALTRNRGSAEGDVQVTFSISGYAITVHSYGVIAIASRENGRIDGPTAESRHK